VDPVALAYYRYERVVEDIAAYCDELLLSAAGGVAPAEALEFFRAQFEANDVVEIACRSDLLLNAPPWRSPSGTSLPLGAHSRG